MTRNTFTNLLLLASIPLASLCGAGCRIVMPEGSFTSDGDGETYGEEVVLVERTSSESGDELPSRFDDRRSANPQYSDQPIGTGAVNQDDRPASADSMRPDVSSNNVDDAQLRRTISMLERMLEEASQNDVNRIRMTDNHSQGNHTRELDRHSHSSHQFADRNLESFETRSPANSSMDRGASVLNEREWRDAQLRAMAMQQAMPNLPNLGLGQSNPPEFQPRFPSEGTMPPGVNDYLAQQANQWNGDDLSSNRLRNSLGPNNAHLSNRVSYHAEDTIADRSGGYGSGAGGFGAYGAENASHGNLDPNARQMSFQTPAHENPSFVSTPGYESPGAWKERLVQAIDSLETNRHLPRDQISEAERRQSELILRFLYLLSENIEAALIPIDGMSESETDYWNEQFYALHELITATNLNMDSTLFTSNVRRNAIASQHIRSALAHLGGMASLQIRNLALCEAISGFGRYQEFTSRTFSPGDEMLIYCELENLTSRQVAGAQHQEFESELQGSLVVYDENRQLVSNQEYEIVNDQGRNHRLDFYVHFAWRVPDNLPDGDYSIYVSVDDRLGNKRASSALPIEFRVHR